MGTIDTIGAEAETIVASAASWRRRAGAAVVALWRSLAERQAKRHSRSALRDLSRDQLRDIGLTPQDVRREVAKSVFWD